MRKIDSPGVPVRRLACEQSYGAFRGHIARSPLAIDFAGPRPALMRLGSWLICLKKQMKSSSVY